VTAELLLNARVSVTGQQAAAELGKVETAVNRVDQAQKRLTQTSGQLRASTANLGQQIGDVSQGLAAGTPLATIYAQQIGQIAFAASGMGGRLGAVATFLSGPWGAAITGATVILGALFSAHSRAASGAEKQASAIDAHKKALEDLDRATGRTVLSEEERIARGVRMARQDLEVAKAIRARLAAQLELARADLEATQTRAGAIGPRGEVAALGLPVRQNQIGGIEQAIGANAAAIATTEAQLRAATYANTLRDVETGTSAAARATRAYNLAKVELGRQVTAGTLSEGDARKALEKKRDAVEAAQQAVKDGAAAQREHNKELRDAARDAERAAEAANRFAEAQARALDALNATGRDFARDLAVNGAPKRNDSIDQAVASIDTGRAAGKAFNAETLTGAIAVGQAIGGSAGRAISGIAGLLQGARTGNFTGVGGQTGGLLTLLGGVKGGAGSNGASFAQGFDQAFKAPLKDIGAKFDTFLGKGAGSFAKLAGQAAGGAATGSIVSGIGDALGIKNSKAGAQVGGALGAMIPGLGPFGGLIGSLAGGLLGGLFMSKPKGSTTVSAVDGKISQSSAGDAAVQKATGQIGNSVTDAIQAIADQLGASIGSFSVSIGKEGERFRVDTTGSGSTKKNNSTVLGFGDDAGAALAAAIVDALKDGAIRTSPRVQAALTAYGDNVNKAVAEALKVKGLEDLLGDRNNPFTSAFRNLETQLKQRLDVAGKYGFDLVEIERVNGEDRAKALKDTLSAATGSVRNLLNDLQFGSRATGSPTERLAGLTAERDRLAGLVRGGDTTQLDAVASVVQQIVDLQKETFGITGAAVTGRAESISLLNDLVSQTEERIKAAAEAAKAATATTNDKLTELNASADDQVRLQNEMLGRLSGIEQILGSLTVGPSLTPNFARTR
jgi:hypothetical protein